MRSPRSPQRGDLPVNGVFHREKANETLDGVLDNDGVHTLQLAVHPHCLTPRHIVESCVCLTEIADVFVDLKTITYS